MTPTPRPGTGRQILILMSVLVLGIALGVSFKDVILTVVGSLVGALAAMGERK